MGRVRNIHNELRGGLGPHEAVRVDCGAVALRAWGLSVDSTAAVEPTLALGAAVTFTSLGLRSRGRRIDPVLSATDVSSSIGAGSGLTDA